MLFTQVMISKTFNASYKQRRKLIKLLSLLNVWRKNIHFKYQKLRQYCVCLFLLYSFSSAVLAADNKSITFNIPRQRADLSLISFAEQANITLLFPFEQLEDKLANPILGKYTLMEALDILIKDTGLKRQVSDNGQLSILIDPNFDDKNDIANVQVNKFSSTLLDTEDSPSQLFEDNHTC